MLNKVAILIIDDISARFCISDPYDHATLVSNKLESLLARGCPRVVNIVNEVSNASLDKCWPPGHP